MPSFLLASSTEYGIKLAESLLENNYLLKGVLTPSPAPKGRKQTLTPSSTQIWAEQNHWPVFTIKNKIFPELQNELPASDFLLVVDFGYLIPTWLINHPQQLAFNIHPSALPKYRGASPGQYAILHGESQSAVSFIKLSSQMDAGDILQQIPFSLSPTWTSRDYYLHAFRLAAQHLPALCNHWLAGKITPTPQKGEISFAPQINKNTAFIPWSDLLLAINGNQLLANKIERAMRAFSPWPYAWTIAPTKKGEKRLQLLTGEIKQAKLQLLTVKLEADTSKPWSSVSDKINWQS